MRYSALVLFGCVALLGACHRAVAERSCRARFSSPMAQGVGTTHATYTFDVTGLRADRIRAVMEHGIDGTGAPRVSAVSGNAGGVLARFLRTSVDARGTVLLADRNYLRIRPAPSPSMTAALDRGCRAEGGGVRLIAIAYDWPPAG